MTSPALVILAAGLGSRYGGAKQLQPVGPGGETLMDYSIFDALRAGFDRIIFVTRPDLSDEFEATIASRYRSRIQVELVAQRLDDLPVARVPAGRSRPWGTGQAIWSTRHVIDGPFAVLNADDFYGLPALTEISRFLY
ncbi:MAG: NTP transferase domain-containing protein, partial [Gemmatimonadota bacterium]